MNTPNLHATHSDGSAVSLTRRRLFQLASAGSLALWPSLTAAGAPAKRLRVAAVITELTYRSHAHVILENFLEPYLFNGKRTESGMDVVALFADQSPQGDMLDDVAKTYGIPVFKTIPECLRVGGSKLAVDAVLSIGEHGQYPFNSLGQHEYPRKRFFDEIVATMRASGRYVPVFTDKHLSYRWDWAKEMYDTARELGIPLMAGSSVPLAQRIPPLELPAAAEIQEAVSIHGGGVESYDFHALKVLQSMVESRKGGESGISQVEFLDSEALAQAADAGRISVPLAQAAMDAENGPGKTTAADLFRPTRGKHHGILLTYKDGFRATILKVGGSATRWNFACLLKGETQPRATRFYVGPWNNRNLFKGLSHAIQAHFREGVAPYPVERTLLVTGVLDAAMHSRAEQGKVQKTPHLEFGYAAKDFRAMREMGASWKIITEETPEPKGFDLSSRERE